MRCDDRGAGSEHDGERDGDPVGPGAPPYASDAVGADSSRLWLLNVSSIAGTIIEQTATPTAGARTWPDATGSGGSSFKIAVIGGGSWGTALAVQLGRSGIAVRLWARDPALARAIGGTRENRRYLPDIHLPESVVTTADPAEALDGSDLVFRFMPLWLMFTNGGK